MSTADELGPWFLGLQAFRPRRTASLFQLSVLHMGAPNLRPFDGPDRVVAHGDHVDGQAIQQRCKDMGLHRQRGDDVAHDKRVQLTVAGGLTSVRCDTGRGKLDRKSVV